MAIAHTISRGSRREALREGLRSASIGPVQHVQRLQRRRRGRHGRFGCALRGGFVREERGGGDREEARSILTRERVDDKVVGLDAKRLFDLELVCGVVHDEVESLEDRDEHELHLLPCEGTALS